MNIESSSIIAAVMDGTHHGPSASINGVAFDSRLLTKGNAFVALKDQRDGHDYAALAIEKGASVLIVERLLPLDVPQIVVKNTLKALTKWSHWHRLRSSAKVIGVTGSCGKTTFKNLLTHVLSAYGPTVSTYKNLNNEIGVPMTLLHIEPKHRYAVIEMGASGPGDIDHLAQTVACDVSVITCAAPAHLDRFRTLAGVVDGKGELYRAARKNSTAILNADDSSGFPVWKKQAKHLQSSTVGKNATNDVQIKKAHQTKDGLSLVVSINDNDCTVRSTLQGKHFAVIIGLVIETARKVGVPMQTILDAIATFPSDKQRLNIKSFGKHRILDDCYNANPFSVRAAIDVLTDFKAQYPLFILGQMYDLGDEKDYWHEWAAAYAAGQNCTLWFLGESESAVQKGNPQARIFRSIDELKRALTVLRDQHTVLVKGSRAMKMERIWEVEEKIV